MDNRSERILFGDQQHQSIETVHLLERKRVLRKTYALDDAHMFRVVRVKDLTKSPQQLESSLHLVVVKNLLKGHERDRACLSSTSPGLMLFCMQCFCFAPY